MDLRPSREVRKRTSYFGKTGFPWWAQVDSNHRPYAYQAYALNHLSYEPILIRPAVVRFIPSPFGGDEEDRTPDPLRARQVLSQLSYTPVSGFRICRSYLILKTKAFKIEQHSSFKIKFI